MASSSERLRLLELFELQNEEGPCFECFRTSEPVAKSILERMPATAELALAAMVVAILVSIPLGTAAAVWRGTGIDHAAMTVALLGISAPSPLPNPPGRATADLLRKFAVGDGAA